MPPQIQQNTRLEVDRTASWGGNKRREPGPRQCETHSAALQPQSRESSEEPLPGATLLLRQEAKRAHHPGPGDRGASAASWWPFSLFGSRSPTWARATGKEVCCPVCERRAESRGGADRAQLRRPVSEKRNADTPARRRPVRFRCNSEIPSGGISH